MLLTGQRWSLIRVCAVLNPSYYQLPLKKVIHFRAPCLYICFCYSFLLMKERREWSKNPDITLTTWLVNDAVHLKYHTLQALLSKAHFSHIFKPSIARGQQKSSRHWIWVSEREFKVWITEVLDHHWRLNQHYIKYYLIKPQRNDCSIRANLFTLQC